MQKRAERELGKEQRGKDKTIADLEAKVDKLMKLMEDKIGEKI